MNEKSSIEKNAAQKQAGLLAQALAGAGDAGRYWLNPSGKTLPRFYPKGVSVSPFNALVMQDQPLHPLLRGKATRGAGTRTREGCALPVLQLEQVREPQQPGRRD